MGLLKVVSTIPGDKAFRPIDRGRLPGALAKSIVRQVAGVRQGPRGLVHNGQSHVFC